MKGYLDKTIFRSFKKDLAAKYGENKAEKIWKYANKEYLKLKADEPNADKTSRSYVFPVVSIYRAVEKYDPGEALGMTRTFGTKTGLKLKKKFRRLTALPGIPTLMWKNMDKIAAKMSDGYEVKNLKVDNRCDDPAALL